MHPAWDANARDSSNSTPERLRRQRTAHQALSSVVRLPGLPPGEHWGCCISSHCGCLHGVCLGVCVCAALLSGAGVGRRGRATLLFCEVVKVCAVYVLLRLSVVRVDIKHTNSQ